MRKIISLLISFLLIISTVSAYAVTPETTPSESPFTDLPVSSNAYLSVMALVDDGIIEGKTEDKFYPKDSITRAEVAKVVVLAAEVELVSTVGTFTDVLAGQWYTPYIETANATGLMEGISSTEFSPDATFSRQDAAVLAIRLAEKLGIQLENIYPDEAEDAASVSDYAKDAVDKCLKMNFADLNDGNFEPTAAITRMDFCEMIDRVRISDPTAYNDIIQEKMPVAMTPNDSNSIVLVEETFENGISYLKESGPRDWGENTLEYIESDVGKDGSKAIKLSDNKRAVNLYLEIDPGTNYYISYDVKANINSDRYFRANFEYYDSFEIDANSISTSSGSYDRNGDISLGETDWETKTFKSTSPTPDLMPEVLRIALMIEGGETGDDVVYIDNLKIYKTVYYPMTAMLISPSYKGLIYKENGENDIVLNTFITGLRSLYNSEETYVEAVIEDMNGNIITSVRKDNPTDEMTVCLSSKVMEIGEYCLNVRFREKATDNIIGEDYWILRKRPPDEEKTRYYFDEYGRLVKNGEPIFMFGTYARAFDKEDDGEYAYLDLTGTINVDFENSPSAFFNSRSILDTMAANGTTVMVPTESKYSLSMRKNARDADVTNHVSERVILERFITDRGFVGETGVAGYLINDEFPPDEWRDRVQWHNNIISNVDIDAPTFGVHIGSEENVKQFWHSHDIYAADPYPIGGKETDKIERVYNSAKAIDNATKNRPFWMVTQLSDLRTMGTNTYLSKNDRGPNETEMRNMAWQAVCGGAQGICWYAHFDLEKTIPEEANGDPMREKDEVWAECVKVSDEVKNFEDAILSVEDVPVTDINASASEMLCSTVRRYNGKTYVMLVNMDKAVTQAVNVSTAGINSADAYYNHSLNVSENSVELSLAPYEVEVLVIDQDEFKSHDAELDDIQFSNGTTGYFVTIVDGVKTIYLPEGVNSINYRAKINRKSRITIKECPAETCPATIKGTVDITGKDAITFYVRAEDGTTNTYTYNIARE